MNSERTKAYRRVMETLDELGPSKLQSGEQDRIRLAADNLIFSSETGDGAVQGALRDAEALCASLVDSGRWEAVTAERLERDLRACGPGMGLTAAA